VAVPASVRWVTVIVVDEDATSASTATVTVTETALIVPIVKTAPTDKIARIDQTARTVTATIATVVIAMIVVTVIAAVGTSVATVRKTLARNQCAKILRLR
jgi:hypothetical protein